MKKLFYLTTLLGCSCLFSQNFSLYATQSMVISPNSSSSTKDIKDTTVKNSPPSTEIKRGGLQNSNETQHSTDQQMNESLKGRESIKGSNESKSLETDDKGQMAGWMLESSQVAKDYVTSLDNGEYLQSWNKGDSLFQETITQEEWDKALKTIRQGLGKATSRALKSQRPAWNPQGLPKGPYMVVEYETSFKEKPATEILTLRRGVDGKWRVLTYQVN